MTRLANRERAQLLVQSGSRPRLQGFLANWMLELRKIRAGKVRWSLDVDPLEL
jgi:primosomal protein N' (replication factor Y)